MADLNRLQMMIGGKEYILKSARSDEEMRRIVAYAEQKIDEAYTGSRQCSDTMRMTLAAINLTDELFTEKEEHVKLQNAAKGPMEMVGPLEQEREELRLQVQKLETENRSLRAESAREHSDADMLRAQIGALQETIAQMEKIAVEKDEDLAILQEMMDETEKRQLELAKQFQEYRRTHR